MPNVFLTGEIQTGKSTAIRRFLYANPAIRVGGFVTVSTPPDGNGVREVHILPPDYRAEDVTADNTVGRRGGRYECFPAVFDAVGTALLTRTGDFDLLLMDELGRMELRAERFCEAVLCALDGDVPVLGVIKPCRNALLDAVRAHPKTVVLELTAENRDGIPARIAELFGNH